MKSRLILRYIFVRHGRVQFTSYLTKLYISRTCNAARAKATVVVRRGRVMGVVSTWNSWLVHSGINLRLSQISIQFWMTIPQTLADWLLETLEQVKEFWKFVGDTVIGGNVFICLNLCDKYVLCCCLIIILLQFKSAPSSNLLRVVLVFSCSKIGSMRDDPHWTSTKNCS
jgi:hypothetical protein